MTSKWTGSVAAIALLASLGAARAESADVATLKEQTEALKQQNARLAERLSALEQPTPAQAAPASSDFLAQAAKAPVAALAGDGPITWKGLTLFGAVDMGFGYASHGLPLNSKYYYGSEMLQPKASHAQWGLAPNALQLSNIGVKGETELLPGLAGVFQASTLFNPHSGTIQNSPGAIIMNNGLNYRNYSIALDGARGGQAFSDQLYVGFSSKTYGQLTFGRHRNLSSDLLSAYDPTGVSSAFSIIGSSGTYVSGQGVTETGRWDNSLKYRIQYESVRFAAMYKFVDGNGGCNYLSSTGLKPAGTTQECFATHNDAGQVSLGGDYGGFSMDGMLGYFNQGTYVGSPLTAAQFAGADSYTSPTGAVVTSTSNSNANTLAATVSDMTGGALGLKYTWDQWKLYGGWSHTIAHNPKNPLGIGATNDQGGYILSSANNAAFPHARLQDTFWVGFRYAYNEKTEIIGVYEHVHQNAFGYAAGTPGAPTSLSLATCNLARFNPAGAGSNPRSNTCAGDLDQGSLFVDYHFTKRFDVYGGLNVEALSGGMASGYIYTNIFSPTVGARYRF